MRDLRNILKSDVLDIMWYETREQHTLGWKEAGLFNDTYMAVFTVTQNLERKFYDI